MKFANKIKKVFEDINSVSYTIIFCYIHYIQLGFFCIPLLAVRKNANVRHICTGFSF